MEEKKERRRRRSPAAQSRFPSALPVFHELNVNLSDNISYTSWRCFPPSLALADIHTRILVIQSVRAVLVQGGKCLHLFSTRLPDVHIQRLYMVSRPHNSSHLARLPLPLRTGTSVETTLRHISRNTRTEKLSRVCEYKCYETPTCPSLSKTNNPLKILSFSFLHRMETAVIELAFQIYFHTYFALDKYEEWSRNNEENVEWILWDFISMTNIFSEEIFTGPESRDSLDEFDEPLDDAPTDQSTKSNIFVTSVRRN